MTSAFCLAREWWPGLPLDRPVPRSSRVDSCRPHGVHGVLCAARGTERSTTLCCEATTVLGKTWQWWRKILQSAVLIQNLLWFL